MGSITLLLGKNRRRRKQSMSGLGHAGLDSRNRPLFLVLTATQRKAEGVRREFVQQEGKPPTFAPEVRVFSEYLESLAARHVCQPNILSDSARAQLALRILESRPELSSPTLSEAESLVRAHSLISESCAAPSALQLPPTLLSLIAELDRDIQARAAHTTLQSALGRLGQALLAPSGSLQADLQRFPSVVIDDILQLTPLRRSLLIALSRAWEQLGTHVVVCFESSRFLGGPEVGSFFDFDPLLPSAYPLRAFDASKALRCALFEEFVGQGDGRICVAAPDGPRLIEPGTSMQSGEAPDLSDHVYSQEPLPISQHAEALALLQGRVSILECSDPYEEQRSIAGALQKLIGEGAAPSDCCVAVADLETQLPVLGQVFEDHGLVFDVATGPPLASLPVPALLLAIPQCFEDTAPALSLLRVLQTDLVTLPEGSQLEGLWAACQVTGIHEGEPLDWLAQWEERHMQFTPDIRAEALAFQSLFDGLSAVFTADHTPSTLEQALLQTCGMLGLPGSCHIQGAGHEALRIGYLSWSRSVEKLDSWRRDLQAVVTTPIPVMELVASLTRTFQKSRLAIPLRRDDAIKVVGILELRGLTPKHLFLSNLVRSTFPSPRAVNVFLPDDAARRVETVDPMSEARYLLFSALRNSLGDGDIQTLCLSWPTMKGGRESVPASALQDLLSVQTRCPDGSTFGDFIVQRPDDYGAVTRTDLLVHQAQTQSADHGGDAPLLGRQLECVTARAQNSLSKFNGQLSNPPSLPSALGPTGVESYLKCGARHWYRRVLQLASPPMHEPQVSPGIRGTAMHRILERYEKESDPHTDGATRLHTLASEVFDQLRDGYLGDPILLEIERERMSAGLVDSAPGGPLKAWLELETTHQEWRVAEASELAFEDIELGPVVLRGAIDRVDRLPSLGGHLVIDFKTGSVPAAAQVQQGLAFQPIAYLEATSRLWPGESGVAAYMSIGKAGNIAFNTWVGDPDLIESLVPKRRRRSAVALDAEQRKSLLDYAARSMERMFRGVFHTTFSPPEDAGCASCDFQRICRVNPLQNQRIADTGGDLQLPFDGQET